MDVTEAPVPKTAPVMVAWTAYKATPEFANSFRWAAKEEHRDGSMWAAFYAGFYAAAINSAGASADLLEAAEAHVAARDALEGASVHSLFIDDPRFAAVTDTLATLRDAIAKAGGRS